MRDLKTRTGFIKNITDFHNVVNGLREISDKMNTLLHSNGFFYNTFELPMMEIQRSIEELLVDIQVPYHVAV